MKTFVTQSPGFDLNPSDSRHCELFAIGGKQINALKKVAHPLYLIAGAEQRYECLTADQLAERNPPLSALLGMINACPPDALGDALFRRDHGLRYAYVGGSMAKGISSVNMVRELGRAGMLGFFGAAGLGLDEVEAAVDRLQSATDPFPFGVNLIHSPSEPELEKALVDLYLRRDVRLVEASAFLALTLPVVRYRTHGLHRNTAGEVVAPNRIIAKVSREEVAARFFSPPPEKMLKQLVESGDLTVEQAAMAAEIPVAQDVTVEADSGGHTDNRPALALFPTLAAQKDEFQSRYGYRTPLRVGLGGGIGTPAAAAAAFSLGAAYLVTGTVNQACIESGTCDEVRQMLAETRQADVTMAPSGDMFEMGVKVQVIKRGTMFSVRAHKLYELYKTYAGIEALPADERDKLEKSFFRASCDEVWNQTRAYFSRRDPRQIEKAEADPKYKMALIFRWYLGQSPVWANRGDLSRKIDFQIWCGPAMGAFNEWTRDTFLSRPQERRVATVAMNLLFGAAVSRRAAQLPERWPGADLHGPLTTEQIKEYLS